MRHGRTFLLMATHGKHRFFEEEKGSIRDTRKTPIKNAGYSISYWRGQDGKYHPHVRIEREQLKTVAAFPMPGAATIHRADCSGTGRPSVRAVRADSSATFRVATRCESRQGYVGPAPGGEEHAPVQATGRTAVLRRFIEVKQAVPVRQSSR